MKQYKPFTYSLLSVLFLISFGCSPVPPVQQPTTQTTVTSVQPVSSHKPTLKAVSITIDTGLRSPVLEFWGYKRHKQRKVLQFKTDDTPFQVKSFPSGTILFQETFVRTKGNTPIIRNFTSPDTAKFYRIHIQNGDSNGNNLTTSAVLNLNGVDWIRPNDFSGKGKNSSAEIVKDSVLLNANNTLTLDHHGSPGSTFTLTVIEGGQAGTIRRRNGPLNEHPPLI